MYQQFMKAELYHTNQISPFFLSRHSIHQGRYAHFFFDNRSHSFTLFSTHYFRYQFSTTCATSAWLWNRTVQNPYNKKHADWNGRMQVAITYIQSSHYLGESN